MDHMSTNAETETPIILPFPDQGKGGQMPAHDLSSLYDVEGVWEEDDSATLIISTVGGGRAIALTDLDADGLRTLSGATIRLLEEHEHPGETVGERRARLASKGVTQ
jgi:hypothetical protein